MNSRNKIVKAMTAIVLAVGDNFSVYVSNSDFNKTQDRRRFRFTVR